MKNLRSLFVWVSLLFYGSLFAQTKKPTIMIMPSDNWCVQRYFTTDLIGNNFNKNLSLMVKK